VFAPARGMTAALRIEHAPTDSGISASGARMVRIVGGSCRPDMATSQTRTVASSADATTKPEAKERCNPTTALATQR
jgi:hypothetical protein